MTGMAWRSAGFLVGKGRDGTKKVKEILWGDQLPRRPRGIVETKETRIETAIAQFLGKRGWTEADIGIIISEPNREEAMRFPIEAYLGTRWLRESTYNDASRPEDIWCVLSERPAMVARLAADGFVEAWSLNNLSDASWAQNANNDLPMIKIVETGSEVRWTGRTSYGVPRGELPQNPRWDEIADVISAVNLDLEDPIVSVPGITSSTDLLRYRIDASASDMDRCRQLFTAAMIVCKFSDNHIIRLLGVGVDPVFPWHDPSVGDNCRRLILPGSQEAFSECVKSMFGEELGNLLGTRIGRHFPIGRALLYGGKFAPNESSFLSQWQEGEAPFVVDFHRDASAHQKLEAASLLEDMLVADGLSEAEARSVIDTAKPRI